MGNSLETFQYKKDRHLVIMIRGHIRQSFKNDNLYLFIRKLMTQYNIFIYIHTWDIVQNNISWRKFHPDNTPVTENMIYNYFRECRSSIKNIIIESDKNINLIGNIIGTVCNTKMPIVGWKNMWYGMNSAISKISNDIPPQTPILNIRFDIFDVFKNTPNNINQLNAYNFIEKNYDKIYNKNVFYYNSEKIGIDNIILGNVYTMFRLINHFYIDLDNILLKYPNNKNQEFLVFRENNVL
jgi:hypothetical protein